MVKIKLLFSFIILCIAFSVNAQNLKDVQNPKEALEMLKEGNTRFIKENLSSPNRNKERIENLENSQKPYAAIVTCSDSRVPAELIFDCGFGDIFVIRTAGNSVVDNSTQGSVDYAVNHLDVDIVVVMGHTNCGAIKAVVTPADPNCTEVHDDGEVPALIGKISEYIPEYKGKKELLNEAISANTLAQTAKIASLPHIKEKVDAGKLMVVSAVYDIKTGEVTFFNF